MTIPEGYSIAIRSCKTGGESKGGFIWPTEPGSIVECPDWEPTKECGNGLHGLLSGQNDPGAWYDDLVLVLQVETATIIDLGGKIKFPRAEVLFAGANPEAHEWLKTNNLAGSWYHSTQTAGCHSTQTAGYDSTQTAGYHSTQTAGYDSTQTAGNRSTQTAGDGSTQTAGGGSTQTAGGGSVSIAGPNSRQKATNGLLVCRWYDYTESKYKFATAVAGVDVEDGVFYAYDINTNAWVKSEAVR